MKGRGQEPTATLELCEDLPVFAGLIMNEGSGLRANILHKKKVRMIAVSFFFRMKSLL